MILRALLLALALLLITVPSAHGAIAFDAASNSGAITTGNMSWTHTPSGTPRGVVVLIAQEDSEVAAVSAITYGGTAMTAVAGSPNMKAAIEGGGVYIYFLGASVPTGAQTVAITVSNVFGRQAVAITVTASADTSVEDTDASINSDSVTNPSGTLVTAGGLTTFVAAALFSGCVDAACLGVGADYTEILETDTGSQMFSFMRRTSNPGGGNVTFDWTQTTEDAVAMAVAVKEDAAAGGGRGRLLLFRGGQ